MMIMNLEMLYKCVLLQYDVICMPGIVSNPIFVLSLPSNLEKAICASSIRNLPDIFASAGRFTLQLRQFAFKMHPHPRR